MAVRMKQDGVYEDELRQLAASINFEIKSDDDLIRLFHEAKKLGFWPNLDIPRPNKKGFHVPRTGELKPLFIQKRVKGSRLNESWDDWDNKSKKTKKVDERLDLAKELERLTKLANALESPKQEEELDEWLNNI